MRQNRQDPDENDDEQYWKQCDIQFMSSHRLAPHSTDGFNDSTIYI